MFKFNDDLSIVCVLLTPNFGYYFAKKVECNGFVDIIVCNIAVCRLGWVYIFIVLPTAITCVQKKLMPFLRNASNLTWTFWLVFCTKTAAFYRRNALRWGSKSAFFCHKILCKNLSKLNLTHSLFSTLMKTRTTFLWVGFSQVINFSNFSPSKPLNLKLWSWNSAPLYASCIPLFF